MAAADEARVRGVAVFLAAVLLTSCAADREAERTRVLRAQDLEARAGELENRLKWTAEQQAGLASELEAARKRAAALEEERSKAQARNEDLSARLKTCSDREGGLRADLDLSRRACQAAEEQRTRTSEELAAAQAAREAEKASLGRALESCRGRVADLEAQAGLLSAESRREEMEKKEKVDELTRTYGGLVEGLRQDLAACRSTVGRLETSTADADRLRAGVEAADCERRLEADRSEAVRQALVSVLAPEVGVKVVGQRVVVTVAPGLAFDPKGLKLSKEAKGLLQSIVGIVQQVEGAAVEVGAYLARPDGKPERGKKAPDPWESSYGQTVSVGRWLEELGVEPARLRLWVAASSLPAEDAAPAPGGPGALEVAIVVPKVPCTPP